MREGWRVAARIVEATGLSIDRDGLARSLGLVPSEVERLAAAGVLEV